MKKQLSYLILGIVLIAILFWSSVSLQTLFLESVELTESYITEHPILGVSFFLWLAAASAILSPFSSVVLVPFVVPTWGIPFTIFLLALGWLIGGLIAYAIGRYAGHPILKRILPLNKIEKFHQQLPDDTSFWVLLLFRLATPSELVSYFLGIIRYRFWHYFLATLISEIVFAFLTVYLSDAIIENQLLQFGAVLVSIFVISLGTWWLLARRKSHKKRR